MVALAVDCSGFFSHDLRVSKRVFLPSSLPLLPQIVDRLLPAAGSGPLRMEDTWILVPTRQSGRRLREALTKAWRERGGTALLGLEVHPPSILFQVPAQEAVAHAFDWMDAWQQILTRRDPESLPALMPQLTEPLTDAVALPFGQRLQRLRDELFDAGLDLSSVAESPLLSSEQARWQDLASLETEYRVRLEQIGVRDPVDAKRDALRSFTLPEQVKRLVLAGVPDPSPIVLKRLQELDQQTPCEIWIHAEENEAGLFSDWGIPTEAWRERSLGTGQEPEGWIECLASPAAVMDRMQQIAREAPDPPELALGLLESSLSLPLAAALESEGRALYDPSPVSLSRSPLVRMLNVFHQHQQRDDPESLRALWRQPVLLKALSPEDPLKMLKAWDRYASRSFPDSNAAVDQTLTEGDLRDAWEQIKAWVSRKTARDWLDMLNRMTRGEELNSALPEDRFRLRQVEQMVSVLQEAARREEQGRGPAPGIILQALARETVDPLRVEGGFTAEGWLELPFHPAENLLLIGMQEGLVPPPPPRDPILPRQLREELGLKSDRDWLARDAYLFHTLLTSRQPGQVRVWVMKRARDGSPLMPSRLLFACDDHEFLQRATLLFSDPAPPPPIPPPSPGLCFHPERVAPKALTSLSVSNINAYLACPTRFYYQVMLGMESCDDLTAEPDAASFGTLLHRVLEDVVKAGPCEQREWDDRCDAVCTEALRLLLGRSNSMSHRVLEHAAHQRLHAAGRIQIGLWQEGWMPLEYETSFSRPCRGLEIKGKVDRIDRHPEKGLRILDYKTADSPVEPEKAHLGPPREGRESIQLEIGSKLRQWKNLQLPLYRWLAETRFPDESLEVAYFNLPSAVSDTGIASWDREPELAPAAEQCLEAVVDLIQNGVWHPTTASSSPWDPYAPLL